MTGLWLHWAAHFHQREVDEDTEKKIDSCIESGFKLIKNNPILLSPLCDHQAIEIALFLVLASFGRSSREDISSWLREMASRMDFTVRTHGRYPTVHTDYSDLVSHPRESTDTYRQEATSGSILIPLLAAWLIALDEQEAVKSLVELKQSVLEHCTLQLWLPDAATEDKLYSGDHDHGIALCDLPLSIGTELLDTIAKACETQDGFAKLSPWTTGYWPVILIACRHFRYPVPPQFWIEALLPSSSATEEA